MLTRVDQVRPFAITMTSVPAASVSPAALAGIERVVARGKRQARGLIEEFLRWVDSAAGCRASPAEVHRRYRMLRLRFNAVVAEFDIFAEAVTQRSEQEHGLWLAGLDRLAEDALALPGAFFTAPPIVCYLERGAGAAIRRAQTILPGGGASPVAIIKIPRERMVGGGIASSLVHEAGHQAAALLNLAESLGPSIRARSSCGCVHASRAWRLFGAWLGEILADVFAVGRLGIGATMGLMAVVGFSPAFVFHFAEGSSHPFPYARVKLGCAFGRALFPHPQWTCLEHAWESYYPLDDAPPRTRDLIRLIRRHQAGLVRLVLDHRPALLRGASLREALDTGSRQPDQLTALYHTWRRRPRRIREASPTLAFAVIGQAKAEGRLGPRDESRLVSSLLKHWALRGALGTTLRCATPRPNRIAVPSDRS